jgi:CHAD domain-containing protein
MRLDDDALDLAAEEGARVVVRGLLAEAVDAAHVLAAGAGHEPLHDFRVAVRRLRSALGTFGPWLGEAARRRDGRRLKRIARATGDARDAEVQLAWLAAHRAEVSAPAHLPGQVAAVAWFEARRGAGPPPEKLARRLRRAARKLRRRLDRADAARDAGSAAPRATFAAALAALATEHAGVLADRIAAIGDATDVEGAHRARIQGKRLRYLLEPLRGSRRADATEAVRALKQLQDLLGELHDAHVLAAELGDALADAAAARARRVHAAVLSTTASAPLANGGHGRPGRGGAAAREALRESARPGLLALLRLVRERRDALHVDLRRAFRDGTVEALAAAIRGLGRALDRGAPDRAPRGAGGSPGPLRARPRRAARRTARRL